MDLARKRKTALVTGGGVRVGRVIAEALAGASFDVLIHYASSEESAKETLVLLRGMGARAEVFRADLLDRADVSRLIEATLVFCGGALDLLVHNAANFDRIEPSLLDADAWDRAIGLNATAPYLLTIGLADALRRARGSVVGIGCLSASRPWKNYIPYSASKAALVSVMQGLSLALAPLVRVNVVSPATVLPMANAEEADLDRLRQKIPLSRLGTPEDVAKAVLFLAEAEFMTGQNLVVDGGRSLV